MWKSIKSLLVILSVALNVAFAGVWLVHVSVARGASGTQPCGKSCGAPCEPGDRQTIWCPLHRELDVSAEQWKELEPRLRTFRAAADAICDRNRQERTSLLEMLFQPEPDMTAIRTKQKEILDAQRQIQALVIEQLSEEKKILTPKQQQHLFDLLRSHSDCEHRGPMLVPGRGIY